MRTEDIVGCSFFALLLVALAATIAGSRTTIAPRRKAEWRGWGMSLLALDLVAMGLANMQLIHNSARPVIEGNLWDIRGSFRSGTTFMITDAAGKAAMIRCSRDALGFVAGERARVQYIAYNRKLVEMDMLTGPYGSWHLRESSGETGWWWVGIGAACGLVGYRELAKARHEQATAD